MNEINSDEMLIHQCRLGDQAALDTIMNKYKPLVIKKARSMFLIGGETEDLIQEGMIGLFKAVRDFELDKSVSFYTFSKLCIERQIYSAVTTAGRMKHSPLNGYISLSQTDDFDIFLNPEEAFLDRERMDMIREELSKKLSPLESNVFKWFMEGYSYAQIAKVLGNKVAVITDNDNNYTDNVVNNYSDYIWNQFPNIQVFADTDDSRYTFEVCIYRDNQALCDTEFQTPRRVLPILDYMIKNKADSAYHLLKNKADVLVVPQYIQDAIRWIDA